MAFIDARLLEKVAYGTSYGSGFKTQIKMLRSGRESRNADWAVPRGRFAIVYGNLQPEGHGKVAAAFEICRGRLNSFRLQDLTDYKATLQPLGVGSGVEQQLQLQKSFLFGVSQAFRPITKPVVDSVQVFEDNVLVAAVVDHLTGIVTITATPGSTLTWSGEFDKVVRFDEDELQFSIDSRAGGTIPLLSTDVSLREVFE
jgi:uncharacterized protein (TIGR02217 family)